MPLSGSCPPALPQVPILVTPAYAVWSEEKGRGQVLVPPGQRRRTEHKVWALPVGVRVVVHPKMVLPWGSARGTVPEPKGERNELW